ncbi:Uracil-DNA glycosylase [Caenispirillum salinarum AK4]|uniref:Type-4 uracil-DNA glycosylase n=1 Tax=Caenispirillum salinarum AK4 TaxID=1238182 RepID=K9H1Z2_9PROT|nr:UdgX family uracil-DNA binding protein [Caenispirillum salinarum]EKV32285.1 Uracil-DNA glycosylase [Caenispirillum salinarum AK4]
MSTATTDADSPTADDLKTLDALARVEQGCTRCPLYRDATQAVPGAGPKMAHVMLVGEQPGDQEDLAGKPFVGPAGRLLDQALVDAGIDRDEVFITNAVKHFKHEPRGKRRLHKRPNASEIDQCRWWLNIERELVRPKVIVGMGVTALRGVLGRAVTITSMRGEPHPLDDGSQLVATIHPSSLLRTRDRADRDAKYKGLVTDLEVCATLLAST